jgi:hypothetical protein
MRSSPQFHALRACTAMRGRLKKRQQSGKAKPGKDRVTLDRAFSKAGMFSRTEALNKITSGVVKVNGKVVREPASWVSLSRDSIQCEARHCVATQDLLDALQAHATTSWRPRKAKPLRPSDRVGDRCFRWGDLT